MKEIGQSKSRNPPSNLLVNSSSQKKEREKIWKHSPIPYESAILYSTTKKKEKKLYREEPNTVNPFQYRTHSKVSYTQYAFFLYGEALRHTSKTPLLSMGPPLISPVCSSCVPFLFT